MTTSFTFSLHHSPKWSHFNYIVCGNSAYQIVPQEDGFNTGLSTPVDSKTITSRRIRLHPGLIAALSYTLYFYYAAGLDEFQEILSYIFTNQLRDNFIAN